MTDQAFAALLDDFVLEATERCARVEQLILSAEPATGAERAATLDEARREVHTLKGNAGMMGLADLQRLAHQIEERLQDDGDLAPALALLDHFGDAVGALRTNAVAISAANRPAPCAPTGREPRAAASSARVPFTALDGLVDLLAEMVIFKNRLADAVQHGRATGDGGWEAVEEAQDALSKTLGLIQERVMRLRMVPLATLFGQLRRIVHDEARRAGTQARLEVAGGETPMDKALLEAASEALGHLVRNAVVHGIEDGRQREIAGKDREGLVRVSAELLGGEVCVTVADDGAGIDRDRVLAVAAEKGLAAPSGDPLTLLFAHGFSTHDSTDLAAGRGFGLAAVLEVVSRVGGRVEVESELGRGTAFRFRMPLSVSIARAMLLRADGELYALPLTSIVESVRLRPEDGHRVNHAAVLRWRGGVIPLLDLGVAFGTAADARRSGYAVIIESEERHRALLVDDLAGIREIVVKDLDRVVGQPQGVSGSTILGDGRVVLILDARALMTVLPFLGAPAGAADARANAAARREGP